MSTKIKTPEGWKDVAGNIVDSSFQILTPLFIMQAGGDVVLHKLGKLRMITPINFLPASRPVMTYFDAFQLPEDSCPPSKIWSLMGNADNANSIVDVVITPREEGGKIQIRYRDDIATFVWMPMLVWVVD